MKEVIMVVKTLEATVRRVGTAVIKGGYILNKVEGQPIIWINRNELQNALSRQEMSPDIPCSELKGAVLVTDYHEITQEEINTAIARGDQALNSRGVMTKGYVININGRAVPFAQPGTKYVLKAIDLSGCEFSNNTVNKIKVSAASFDLGAARNNNRASQAAVAAAVAPATVVKPVTTTTLDAPGSENNPHLTNVPEMPNILKGIKDDAAGNKVNEDGSLLSQDQNEALSTWIQSIQQAEPIHE